MKKEFRKQLIDQKYLWDAAKRQAIKINTQEIHMMWQKYINTIECDMQKDLQVNDLNLYMHR